MHGMLVRILSEKQSLQACLRTEVTQQPFDNSRLTWFYLEDRVETVLSCSPAGQVCAPDPLFQGLSM